MRDKKQGTTIVYYTSGISRDSKRRGVMLAYIIYSILYFTITITATLSGENSPWFNLIFELIIIYTIVGYLLELAWYRRIYKQSIFDIVPENEWEASVKKRKKTRRWSKILDLVGTAISAVFIFLLLLNTYSFTYIRYIANGGAKAAAADVSISYERNSIELNETTPYMVFSIKSIYGKNDFWVHLDVSKYPGDIDIYINGNKVIPHRYGRYPGFIWDSAYFENSISLELNLDILKDLNTLEIKGGNDFYKKWTFTLEYE